MNGSCVINRKMHGNIYVDRGKGKPFMNYILDPGLRIRKGAVQRSPAYYKQLIKPTQSRYFKANNPHHDDKGFANTKE